jgi:hypothetical protein
MGTILTANTFDNSFMSDGLAGQATLSNVRRVGYLSYFGNAPAGGVSPAIPGSFFSTSAWERPTNYPLRWVPGSFPNVVLGELEVTVERDMSGRATGRASFNAPNMGVLREGALIISTQAVSSTSDASSGTYRLLGPPTDPSNQSISLLVRKIGSIDRDAGTVTLAFIPLALIRAAAGMVRRAARTLLSTFQGAPPNDRGRYPG